MSIVEKVKNFLKRKDQLIEKLSKENANLQKRVKELESDIAEISSLTDDSDTQAEQAAPSTQKKKK